MHAAPTNANVSVFGDIQPSLRPDRQRVEQDRDAGRGQHESGEVEAAGVLGWVSSRSQRIDSRTAVTDADRAR